MTDKSRTDDSARKRNDRVTSELMTCRAGTDKWQDRLQEGIAARHSGWYRLSVKLEQGEVIDVQVVADERVPIRA